MAGILAGVAVALVMGMCGFNGIGSGAAGVANILVIAMLTAAGVNCYLDRRWR